MIAALLLAIVQLPLGPSLPAGSSPELNRAFILIEEDLAAKRFDAAKNKLPLLPSLTVEYSWNDSKVPAAQREALISLRDEVFKTWKMRVPGATFKASTKPELKFSFEPSLAVNPESGLPRGVALFFSENPAEIRMEAVVGLKRGVPLEAAGEASLYNELSFAVGSYFGLAPGPFYSTPMGRSDLHMQQKANLDLTEVAAANSISKAVRLLEDAVSLKRSLAPARPKAQFDPAVIERGPVIQGTMIELSVQVNNVGDAPLNFRVIPDCGCITAGSNNLVGPNSSTLVQVKVDTTEIAGDFSKHLILMSNDIEEPMKKFPVNVKTEPRYRFLTQKEGVVIVDEKGLDLDVFLVSPKDRPLEITGIEIAGNPGTATFEPWTGNMADPALNQASMPRQGYKIKVRMEEPQVNGRSATSLVVKTNDPKFSIIRYSILAQRGIASFPSSIFFGELNQNPKVANILLSRPGKPFKITKIDSDSSFVDARSEPTNAKDGSEYRIVLSYSGKAPTGDMKAVVTVFTDDPKQPKIRIPVSGAVR